MSQLSYQFVDKNVFVDCHHCGESWKYTYTLRDKRGKERKFITPSEHAETCQGRKFEVIVRDPSRPYNLRSGDSHSSNNNDSTDNLIIENSNLKTSIEELKREKEQLLKTIQELAKHRGSTMIDARQWTQNVKVFNFDAGITECTGFLHRIMTPDFVKYNLDKNPILALQEEAKKYPETENIDVIINPDKIMTAHNKLKTTYSDLTEKLKMQAINTRDEVLQKKIEELQI